MKLFISLGLNRLEISLFNYGEGVVWVVSFYVLGGWDF